LWIASRNKSEGGKDSEKNTLIQRACAAGQSSPDFIASGMSLCELFGIDVCAIFGNNGAAFI
jgi:hypothetical protein